MMMMMDNPKVAIIPSEGAQQSMKIPSQGAIG